MHINRVLKNVICFLFLVVLVISLVITIVLLKDSYNDVVKDGNNLENQVDNIDLSDLTIETKSIDEDLKDQLEHSMKIMLENDNEIIENATEEDNDKVNQTKGTRKNREKTDTFCFVGDVYPSKHAIRAYDEKGIDGLIDKKYKTLLDSSDLNIGNLECCITDDAENAVDKTFNFALPSKYKSALKESNINLFTLANNHVLDYGDKAMLNTIDELKSINISHIGAGENTAEAKKSFIKEIEGVKYAFIAASAVLPNDDWKASENKAGVLNGYDISIVCEEVRRAKRSANKVIVYMHWGNELDLVSTKMQKLYAHRIIDSGADLVVGSHSHTVQEIEYYKNVPIVYSLGNFIFGQTATETMLLEARFDYSVNPEGSLRLIVHPGLSNYEMVKAYWQKDILSDKISELQDKSSTCYIADNCFVFTIEEVEAALKEQEGLE